jgi:hypothetical protein
MSQKDLILKKLRETGQVSRNACIRGDYGQIITRLSAIILNLRRSGMNIEMKETEKPKETMYYLKDKPKEIIEYRVNGELVGKKVIW